MIITPHTTTIAITAIIMPVEDDDDTPPPSIAASLPFSVEGLEVGEAEEALNVGGLVDPTAVGVVEGLDVGCLVVGL